MYRQCNTTHPRQSLFQSYLRCTCTCTCVCLTLLACFFLSHLSLKHVHDCIYVYTCTCMYMYVQSCSNFPPPPSQPRRGILRHSSDSPGHSPKSSGGHTLSYKSHTLPFTSSPGSKRQTTSSPSLTRRTQTNATNLRPSSPGLRKTYQPVQKTSPLATRKLRSSSGNVMGSGEFDRLEPRPDSMSDVGHHGSHGYSDGMSGMSAPPFGVVPWSPMDGGEWGPGMARAPSLNNDLSSVASSQYPRYPGYSLYPSHPHHPSAMSPSHTPYMNSPNYPPTLDAMATGHTYPPGPRMHNGGYEHQYVDGYHLRGNEAGYPHGYDSSSLRRQEMHPNELPASSIPENDAMSNVSFTAVTLSRDMQAPIRCVAGQLLCFCVLCVPPSSLSAIPLFSTSLLSPLFYLSPLSSRGSNRKDRQKLESNLRVMEAGSSSEQSDIYNHTSRYTHTDATVFLYNITTCQVFYPYLSHW